MPEDAVDERRWRFRRRLYSAGLLVYFCAVAFYFGPNVILFEKLTHLTPADFVPVAERRGVPLVRALRAYERDHGRLPRQVKELVPSYLPDVLGLAYVEDRELKLWCQYNHVVTYGLTPGAEQWKVRGVFASGPLPMPPVPSAPHEPAATTRGALRKRMFCRNCYANLRPSTDAECPACGRSFDPENPKTYLVRPFPDGRGVAASIVGTTVVAILVAFAVAMHQAARSSGH